MQYHFASTNFPAELGVPDYADWLRTREVPGQYVSHKRLLQNFQWKGPQGRWTLECTPWGNPTYNVFGWQKPCYLIDEGHCETFADLMNSTDWNRYGRANGNPKCQDCMVHCGYEPTAVMETFGTLRGFTRTVRLSLFGSRRSTVGNATDL